MITDDQFSVDVSKLSYKSFQKNFGRSVGVRAPGMFISLLSRKAANAGGIVEEQNTRSTKLSQTCICGRQEKKLLGKRRHVCSCGVIAQRDLFSAFLAKHCNNSILDIRQAVLAWPHAEPLVERAMSRIIETANRKALPASFGIPRRQSCSPVKNGSVFIEAVDVVACKGESHGEMFGLAVRTPCH